MITMLTDELVDWFWNSGLWSYLLYYYGLLEIHGTHAIAINEPVYDIYTYIYIYDGMAILHRGICGLHPHTASIHIYPYLSIDSWLYSLILGCTLIVIGPDGSFQHSSSTSTMELELTQPLLDTSDTGWLKLRCFPSTCALEPRSSGYSVEYYGRLVTADWWPLWHHPMDFQLYHAVPAIPVAVCRGSISSIEHWGYAGDTTLA